MSSIYHRRLGRLEQTAARRATPATSWSDELARTLREAIEADCAALGIAAPPPGAPLDAKTWEQLAVAQQRDLLIRTSTLEEL